MSLQSLLDDDKQVVSAGGDRVQGHDVKTGDRIWSIYSQGEGVTPSPVLGEGLIFTSSGFEEPTIRAIRTGGVGDVTETHIAWEQNKRRARVAVVVVCEAVFVLDHPRQYFALHRSDQRRHRVVETT